LQRWRALGGNERRLNLTSFLPFAASPTALSNEVSHEIV